MPKFWYVFEKSADFFLEFFVSVLGGGGRWGFGGVGKWGARRGRFGIGKEELLLPRVVGGFLGVLGGGDRSGARFQGAEVVDDAPAIFFADEIVEAGHGVATVGDFPEECAVGLGAEG